MVQSPPVGQTSQIAKLPKSSRSKNPTSHWQVVWGYNAIELESHKIQAVDEENGAI